MLPSATCQRSTTCATERPCFAAMGSSTGMPSTARVRAATTPRCGCRAASNAAQLRLRQPRVQLDLVHHGRDAGLVDDALEVVRVEVRDADRAHPALVVEPDERAPRVDVAVGRRDRPVDEVEVEPVEAEPRHGRVERAQRLVVAVVVLPHLARDEEVLARQAASRTASPTSASLRVERRGVEVPVAEPRSRCGEPRGIRARHLVEAVADLGDGAAVGERDQGCEGDGCVIRAPFVRPVSSG